MSAELTDARLSQHQEKAFYVVAGHRLRILSCTYVVSRSFLIGEWLHLAPSGTM